MLVSLMGVRKARPFLFAALSREQVNLVVGLALATQDSQLTTLCAIVSHAVLASEEKKLFRRRVIRICRGRAGAAHAHRRRAETQDARAHRRRGIRIRAYAAGAGDSPSER